MIYLIAGKVLSFFIYTIFYKYLYCLEDLTNLDSFLGWFLIEHVYEDYSTNYAKLFLIYEDFRRLIINILFIMRNIFFIAQYMTINEFLLVNFFVFFFSVCYRKKSKKLSFKIIFALVYICILNSFSLISFIHIFMLIFIIVFIYLFKVLINFYTSIFSYFNFPKFNELKIIIVKILSFLVVFFFFVGCLMLNLITFIKINDNFIQEFLIKNLIIYIYTYCLF